MLAILFVRQILAYVEFEMRKIRTLVGTGEKGYAGAGGPAIECLSGEAYGCAFDSNGNLYICDGRNLDLDADCSQGVPASSNRKPVAKSQSLNNGGVTPAVTCILP